MRIKEEKGREGRGEKRREGAINPRRESARKGKG